MRHFSSFTGFALAAGLLAGFGCSSPAPVGSLPGSGGSAGSGGSGSTLGGAGGMSGGGSGGGTALLTHGSPCTADSACVSGVCISTGTCAGNGIGAPSGSACEAATDCASGVCNVTCAPGTNLVDGVSCALPTECATAACTNGVCGVPAGAGGSGGSAGSGGTGGSGGTPPGGPYDVPRGKSVGCGTVNLEDEPGAYEVHDLNVPGVDSYWLTEREPYAGQSPYTFEFRSYAIRLPVGYDPNVPYPIVFQGGGCGNTDGTSGHTGGRDMLPDSGEGQAIQVGLSYVYPDGAGACFQDEGANTYELPYFDAVYAEINSKYCIDLEKVFIGGYSSGAWMAYSMAFARGGVIRGIGTGAGGIRADRPPESELPFAAFMITGEDDGANPVHDTKDGSTCGGTEAEGCWKGETICGFPGAEDCEDEGSAAARDHILERNGCVGTTTEQFGIWPDCKKYTGCPAAFPVVYCMPAGGHTDGEDRLNPGVWDFWSALPAVP
jgi:poly(3-hydroxybutyrate) depolymerase